MRGYSTDLPLPEGAGGGERVWCNEMHFIPSQAQLKKNVSNF